MSSRSDRPPTEHQWKATCKRLRYLADQLESQGFHLIDRGKHESRDGYPSSSLPAGGSASGISDPVGELVAAGEMADPIRRASERMVKNTKAALNSLEAAFGNMENSKPPVETKPQIEREQSIVDCVNCGKPALPRPRAGRCEPCYRYRLDHGGVDKYIPGKQRAS